MNEGAVLEGATPAPVEAAAPAPIIGPASVAVSEVVHSTPATPAASPPPAADAVPAPAETALPIAEAAKVEPEAAGAEPVVEAPPAPVPSYTEFKLPDGFKAEPAQISAYTNILGKYGIPQEGGQELVEFHANEMKRAIQAESQRQMDVFAETRKAWLKQVDKEFGNRRDTAVSDAKWAVAQFAGSKAQAKELWDMMAFTGAGDHPAMVRAWTNVAKKLREREAPPQGLPANSKNGLSPAERRYGAQRA